ncbi:hypothetical protein N7481_013126 [Penicillium waksmanii]|uniref:uncharacterized protein n=1 Tax=Penicillium waksmanii TaxID=69791 RepID=UPI0025496E2E|nr:uncharacterized protein N7481_013126 [Penicillium waksmanii]KAJ5966412.1 hypothetical protein N7481_013126 [Penicillium waksmanii]
MCRQHFTVYEWCHCESDAGYSVCGGARRDSCPGVSIETVHMHCFCNSHASRGFKTEKKSLKQEDKWRRRSQQSQASSSSGSLDEKSSLGRRFSQWYQWRGLRSR